MLLRCSLFLEAWLLPSQLNSWNNSHKFVWIVLNSWTDQCLGCFVLLFLFVGFGGLFVWRWFVCLFVGFWFLFWFGGFFSLLKQVFFNLRVAACQRLWWNILLWWWPWKDTWNNINYTCTCTNSLKFKLEQLKVPE